MNIPVEDYTERLPSLAAFERLRFILLAMVEFSRLKPAAFVTWLIVLALVSAVSQPHPTEAAPHSTKSAGHSHGKPQGPSAKFLSYAQARRVIESFASELPAELQGHSAAGELETLWPQYVRQRDAEIRSRLVQGEEDSLINLVLFGTSFTRQPRITAEFIEQAGKEVGKNGAAKTAAGNANSASDDPVVRAFLGRVADFTRALKNPGGNERLIYMRRFLEGRGYGIGTAAEQERLRQYLLANFARTRHEYDEYREVLLKARQSGDVAKEFAARSTLFQRRGVSLDTSLMPNFALEQALRELLAKGLVAKGAVTKAAIIGPGLDFVDKQEGYDFYPQQTIQPFLVMDSLFRLGLAQPAQLRMTTLDISARVNNHIERARAQARLNRDYVVQLPLESSVHWSEPALDYWKAAGLTIGAPTTPISPRNGVGGLELRAVKVAARHVLRINAVDVDVVYQNLELAPGQRYDLVIATNMFSYYGEFEQALAMANLENMIRPGGFLLTNNGLPENVPVALRQAGFSSTAYSDRPGDGDYIIWYQRTVQEKKDLK